MPATDASAHAGTAPAADLASADSEDTLELRLPDEFIALFGQGRDGAGAQRGRDDGIAPPAFVIPPAVATGGDDLLDHIADWGPVTTSVGRFELVPVRVERDVPLISEWMNDPAVAEFWELDGPQAVTEDHVRAQLSGDGRSVPCLGVLEGTPMSYWEVYRADLDPLARHCPVRPHDTGVHVLIGGAGDRGRGLGSVLLRAVARLVLDNRPACARVVAEPDLRNIASIAAFLNAGFRLAAETDLPAKRAALVIRDRSLCHLL